MTNKNTEHKKPNEAASKLDNMARREALAVLAKQASYMAPAMLAILSISIPRAKAGSF